MKFEIVVIPVSDVDRAKEFYARLGYGGGVYAGPDEPYLFGRIRVRGPDPAHRSYYSFASFRDPDGNGWLFQRVTTRLAGRVDAAATTFASANDLASAFRRAETAHGKYEARIGQGRDANWPDWYAAYMVAEQSGRELPS
jgi:catechol 2,3-dioxygenase-like lactoylglutathione lyase family enzyme